MGNTGDPSVTNPLAHHQLLATLAPAELVVNADTLLAFVGRIHPVLVHFPIALLLAAALFEILHALFRRRSQDSATHRISPAGRACLVLGVLAAAAAAWSGWTREDLEPITGSVAPLIPIHRWLGIAALCAASVALVLAIPARTHLRFARAYRVVLVLAAATVGVAGHYGGSITWGPGYLTEGFFIEDSPSEAETSRSTEPTLVPVVSTVDFARDIEPILSGYCYDCHGPRRQKGKLRLDRRSIVLAREDIIPGDPDGSELLRRVMLDPEDDDFMPEDDDPLSADQIALLRTWIAEGASWGDAPEPVETVTPEPQATAPPIAPAQPALTADQQAAIRALGSLGATITPIELGSADLDAHLELLGDRFRDEHALHLLALGNSLVWLNLARTGVTDETVVRLAQLPNLERLHLENTAVTDAGVAALVTLPRLRYLNLHTSRVTDAALDSISAMPALEQVYLWGSGVTVEGVARLRAARPGLRVEFASE